MSKPRYRWWGFAKNMIRDYPALAAKAADLHSPSVTARLSGMPGHTGQGRTVEALALRQLPPDDQRAYDAVTKAIRTTERLPNGADRIRLIRFAYWEIPTMRLEFAAVRCCVSVPTAKRWHGDFVRLVGKNYGFSES